MAHYAASYNSIVGCRICVMNFLFLFPIMFVFVMKRNESACIMGLWSVCVYVASYLLQCTTREKMLSASWAIRFWFVLLALSQTPLYPAKP